jgi:hypothetical protein
MFHVQILLTGVMPNIRFSTVKHALCETREVTDTNLQPNKEQTGRNTRRKELSNGHTAQQIKMSKWEKEARHRNTEHGIKHVIRRVSSPIERQYTQKIQTEKSPIIKLQNQLVQGANNLERVKETETKGWTWLQEGVAPTTESKKTVSFQMMGEVDVCECFSVLEKLNFKKRKNALANNNGFSHQNSDIVSCNYNSHSQFYQIKKSAMNRVYLENLRKQREEEAGGPTDDRARTQYDVRTDVSQTEFMLWAMMQSAPRCRHLWITNLGGKLEDVEVHLNFLHKLFDFKEDPDISTLTVADFSQCGHMHSSKKKLNLSLTLKNPIYSHHYMTDYSGRELPMQKESKNRRDILIPSNSIYAWMGHSKFRCILRPGVLYRESTTNLSRARPVEAQLTNWNQARKASWKVILILTGLSIELQACRTSVVDCVRNYIRLTTIRQGGNELDADLDKDNLTILWRTISLTASKVIHVGEVMIVTKPEDVMADSTMANEEDRLKYARTSENRITAAIFGAIDASHITVQLNTAMRIRVMKSSALGNPANPKSSAMKRIMVEELAPIQTLYPFVFKRMSAHPNLLYIMALLVEAHIPHDSIAFAAYMMAKEASEEPSNADIGEEKWDVPMEPIVWFKDPKVANAIISNPNLIADWMRPLRAESNIPTAVEYKGPLLQSNIMENITLTPPTSRDSMITMQEIWDKFNSVNMYDVSEDGQYTGCQPFLNIPRGSTSSRARSESPKRKIAEITQQCRIPVTMSGKKEMVEEIIVAMGAEDPESSRELILNHFEEIFCNMTQTEKQNMMRQLTHNMLSTSPTNTLIFMQTQLQSITRNAEDYGLEIEGQDDEEDDEGQEEEYGMQQDQDSSVLNMSGCQEGSIGNIVIDNNAFSGLSMGGQETVEIVDDDEI